MTTKEEKVEEIVADKPEAKEEDDSSSDDEHGHEGHHHHDGHDHDHDHDHEHGHKGDKKANKGEKKFKKAMSKYGMKPVTGINRVTIKKSKAFFLYIDDPEILKSPGADNTYVIFGEAKIQDFSGLGGGQNAAAPFTQTEKPEAEPAATGEKTEAAEPEPAGDDNGDGIPADTIDMVISHTQCSRPEAIRALRKSGGDSVAAIIELTK